VISYTLRSHNIQYTAITIIIIGLIAFLLSFHHWIEKQVIQYLINHKLIDFSRISPFKVIKRQLSRTTQKPFQE